MLQIQTEESVQGAIIVANCELENILEMDNFTLEDRKELMKQGILLEQFHKEIHDLKVGVRESLLKIDQEKMDKNTISLETIREHDLKLRELERASDRTIERLKSIMWIGGFMITLIQAGVEIAIHLWSK